MRWRSWGWMRAGGSKHWWLCVALSLAGCTPRSPAGLALVQTDRSITGHSSYPAAVNPSRVGSYVIEAGNGVGYFYDDVLEYRVWLHPEKGAVPWNGKKDYFVAFAEYEPAAVFSTKTKGAEKPLVLIRQLEWIDEPQPGHYVPKKSERLAEWDVSWLAGSQRKAGSIDEFLLHPRPIRTN